MKKIVFAAIALVMCAAMLAGCAGGTIAKMDAAEPVPEATAAPTPEPTPEPTEMQRVYEAACDAGGNVEYNETYDAVVIAYYETVEFAEKDVAAINEAAQGQPLRIMLRDWRFGGGSDVMYNSFDPAVTDDYYGVDPEKLTRDPAECTRLIVVYADYEDVGWYSNGYTANKTRTTVVVLDPVNRTVCRKKVVATKDPPNEIGPYDNGCGEYLPEKAKDYVLSLLK